VSSGYSTSASGGAPRTLADGPGATLLLGAASDELTGALTPPRRFELLTAMVVANTAAAIPPKTKAPAVVTLKWAEVDIRPQN